MEPAIALLEFESIAYGIAAGDAMVKRAPLELLRCGTVQPGHYLVLIGGGEGEVEEALAAGRETGGTALLDVVHLPRVHEAVFAALQGERNTEMSDALGIVETHTVAGAIHAADVALKGISVSLIELRLADGLGGKGIILLTGTVADVDAGVDLAIRSLSGADQLVAEIIIPQIHAEMGEEVLAATRFRDRIQDRTSNTAWDSH